MIGAAIFAAFVLLGAVMSWILIQLKGNWVFKLALITVVLFFNFAVWNSLDSYRGFPISNSIPKDSIYISSLVEEPNKLEHQSGVIYLWLIPLKRPHGILDYHPDEFEPRAYRAPYTPPLHKATEGAQRIQKQHGVAVLRRHKTRRGEQQQRSSFQIYRLPPPSNGIKR